MARNTVPKTTRAVAVPSSDVPQAVPDSFKEEGQYLVRLSAPINISGTLIRPWQEKIVLKGRIAEANRHAITSAVLI